jgi:hypothetical protein
MAIKILFVFLFVFLSGCSDNSMSKVYDKRILENEIECMRLLVFPPNKMIEDTLNDLYRFDTECKLDLVVSYKDEITCNSNQNVAKKAYGMPSAYLRYELKKENKLYYSYYIDLDDVIMREDIKDGFDRMQDRLNFMEKSR